MVVSSQNQQVMARKGAPVGVSDAPVRPAIPQTLPAGPLPALRDRVIASVGQATVVPAEAVALMIFALPVRGRRRRQQAAAFALEDRLSVAVDQLHVALHPGFDGASALAGVIARARMPADARGPVIVETMAVPVPAAPPLGAVWAIWQTGDKAVVRVSDGSGFGCAAEMLESFWTLAGRPAVTRLADALPDSMAASDLSPAPPAPDRRDLDFDLRQGAFSMDGRHWPSTVRMAAVIAAVGLLAHLGLALADRAALARIARAEVAATEARLAERLPGAAIALGLPALLDRLAPRTETPAGSAFLPLFSTAAQNLLTDAPAADVQRLTWDAPSGLLVLDVTARSLEDLQAIEQSLSRGNLAVETGVATAGEGVARADIRIRATP